MASKPVTASALMTSDAGRPRRICLIGFSSFLPVIVRGIAGTCFDRVGHVPGRQLPAQRGADPVAQGVVERGAVGRGDEQQQPPGAALRVLQVDHQRVGDLGQLLDNGVELGGAEPHPAAVEGRVRAAGDHEAAVRATS